MLDYDKLIDWREPEIVHRYTARDTMLYGLSLGLGQDPVDERALRFVYEPRLLAMPSMATVLASPWGWLYRAEVGVTQAKAVHGYQGLTLLRPLPPEGAVAGDLRVTAIEDKGRDKGAIVHFQRRLHDHATGDLLCIADATMFCRADGGYSQARGRPGGAAGRSRQRPDAAAPPAREPDAIREYGILPQAALMFRLHGDTNPLHADPAHAARAGFPRPILHGLCSYGMATRAVLSAFCDDDPARLGSLQLRFSAPVYPGDTLRISLWRDGTDVVFDAAVPARNAMVLTHGQASVGGPARAASGDAAAARPAAAAGSPSREAP